MNTLPGPLPLVTVLHVVTLTLHLLAMNLLLGSLFFLVLHRSTGEPSPALLRLARAVPTFLTATVSLGVAPLLFVQLVYHRQVYSASIVSAWHWLSIVGAVIAIYLFAYGSLHGNRNTPRRPFLAAAFLLATWVSLVYSGVFATAESPATIRAAYAANPTGTAFPPAPLSWGLRWLHMFTGALAVGSLFVAWWTRRDASARNARLFFLASMGSALLAGFAYLLSLGELVGAILRSRLIWELTVAVLLSLGGTHFAIKERFPVAFAMVGVSTLTMVSIRHGLRELRLAPAFDTATLPVASQWGAFSLFLVCFLAAGATMTFLVRAFREKAPGS